MIQIFRLHSDKWKSNLTINDFKNEWFIQCLNKHVVIKLLRAEQGQLSRQIWSRDEQPETN